MKAPWMGFLVCLSFVSLAHAQDRGYFCDQPNVCVTAQKCVQGLTGQLKVATEAAQELCTFKSYFKEWDIIRLKDVYPRTLTQSQLYISKDLFNESAVELSLFAFTQMSTPQIDDFMACTNVMIREHKIYYLTANDNCEILIKTRPQGSWQKLDQCMRESELSDKTKAMDLCIKKLFPK